MWWHAAAILAVGFLFGAISLAAGIRIGYKLARGEEPGVLPDLPAVRQYRAQEETT